MNWGDFYSQGEELWMNLNDLSDWIGHEAGYWEGMCEYARDYADSCCTTDYDSESKETNDRGCGNIWIDVEVNNRDSFFGRGGSDEVTSEDKFVGMRIAELQADVGWLSDEQIKSIFVLCEWNFIDYSQLRRLSNIIFEWLVDNV